MTAIIETENLTKVFDGTPVLNRVTLNVPQGAICGLVGPNGAGKSTLLMLLLGYYWPTSGTIRFFGEMLTKEAAPMRQRVHLVSPESDTVKSFRVQDQIKYHKLLYHRFDEHRCSRLLKALELPVRARIRNLSLGMKTQLHLALALAAHPDILLLDEPTNGLDPIVKRQLLQLLVQESAVDGTTVLLATHHLDDLNQIANSIAVMHQGRLIADGSLDAFKEKMNEIHFVLRGELPDNIRNRSEVVSHQRKGQLHTLVVEGPYDMFIHTLQSIGAMHIEITMLPLDELFGRLMEKEGYSRDLLLL